MSDTQGATPNERLLAAAREDNDEMLLEVFDEPDKFDINYQDGLGNTALHYAALHGSIEVLEHILTHEDCDVDPVNFIEKATPLHLAVRIADKEARQDVVESLLDAGANTKIKDKNGLTALEYVRGDVEIESLFRRAEAMNAIDVDDIATDEDESDESGSGDDDDDDD